MQYIVTPPQQLTSSVALPASKSISNRMLILNALSLNPDPIENLSDCEDTRALINAFGSESNVFDVKAAGTAMRFLTAFLAGMTGEWIVKGSPRMHERPIFPLVNALVALGARIEYLEKEGFPPLRINGTRLTGGEVYVPGNISSQFVSALLMIAPTMENGLTIHLQDSVISRSYINLTLGLMAAYGVGHRWEENTISIRAQDYVPVRSRVEADWSAASYWYAIVSLFPGAEVRLTGLNRESLQGDSQVASLFADLGVRSEFVADGVVLRHVKKATKKFFHNFVNEPDLAQTFAVACCLHNTPFMFSGLETLRIKETDRVAALKSELGRFGFVLREINSGMLEWDGERVEPESNPVVQTYDDHRMAMAFAPMAVALGKVVIDRPEVVAKSYPAFWSDLLKAGFGIDETK